MLALRRGLATAALCALLAGCGGGNGYNGNGYNGNGYNSNAYYGNGGYNNYNGGGYNNYAYNGGYNTYNGNGYNGYNGYNNSGNQQRPYTNGNATGYHYPNATKAPLYGAPTTKPPSTQPNNNTSGSLYYPNAKCWDCGRS